MWKLGLRPRNFSGNICLKFSVLCLCSALQQQTNIWPTYCVYRPCRRLKCGCSSTWPAVSPKSYCVQALQTPQVRLQQYLASGQPYPPYCQPAIFHKEHIAPTSLQTDAFGGQRGENYCGSCGGGGGGGGGGGEGELRYSDFSSLIKV